MQQLLHISQDICLWKQMAKEGENMPLQPLVKSCSTLGSLLCEVVDGVPVTIPFTNMKVKTPVASVRRFINTGNTVTFYEGGGSIVNNDTGAKVEFIEKDGVYFLKLRIKEGKVDPSLFVGPAP